MTQENKQGERHTWSIENLSTKDLKNSNLWPFKVVRDKGSKISKMECRSLSALEKSFENTSYNISNCPRVLSRYTLLFNALSKLNTQNITHLYITSDFFCYKIEDNTGKSYIGAQNYASKNLYTIEDIKGLCNCVLVKGKIMTRKIDEVFKMYKKTGQYQNVLYDTVSKYRNSRTHMKEIDTSKGFIDILNSDLNFSSLKYLFFGANEKSMYLQEIVSSELLKSISGDILSQLGKELNVYQSRVFEENRFKNYVTDLRNNKGYRTIRKVFDVTNNLSNYTNKEDFEKLFKEVECSTFSELKCEYISEAEQKRIQKEVDKKMEEKKKAEKILKEAEALKDKEEYKKLEEERLKETLRKDIFGITNQILDNIFLMTFIIKKSTEVFNKAVEKNSIELSIWAKNYDPNSIKERINVVYSYFKEVYNKDEKIYPIVKMLKEVIDNDDTDKIMNKESQITILNDFSDNIVPTYFKNDKQSTGFDFKTIEGLKEIETVLKKINRQVMDLYETFLGVQYAIFGSFMKRYTKNGISIAKMLIPYLVNKYKDNCFYITEKVLENANVCFYLVCMESNSLENYNKEGIEVDDKYKGYDNFVKEYLKSISAVEVKTLTHSESNKEEERDSKRYKNLVGVSSCIYDILNQCCVLQDLEIEKSLSDFFTRNG